MLFLLHLAHKMRSPEDGGGRVGIVMNGSPLFNGGAGSGSSNIRQWLLENDLVEAIVALPTSMFFNTGIATYIWLLDNTKHTDRKGLVQLVDGSSFWTKMRKNLGSKGREISDADRAEVVKLYAEFTDADAEYSKVVSTDEFGYWTITVERPLRLRFDVTEGMAGRAADPDLGLVAGIPALSIDEALTPFVGATYMSREKFLADALPRLRASGVQVSPTQARSLALTLGVRDRQADVCVDRKAKPEPDPQLRDTENVPFTYGGSTAGSTGKDEVVAAYFDTEVKPHVSDAWVDHLKTKIGYEIPFTRHFYKYVPPRPLAAIDADLEKQVAKILELLREVEQ
jgi:type I restriction enzyme M protein